MRYITGESITQSSLFPVSLDELIPDDYAVRVIAVYVDHLDLNVNSSVSFAVNSVTNVASTTSFTYDKNGNMTGDTSGRSISYSVFNKPSRITKSGVDVQFFYGADRKRWKRIDTDGSGTVTTYYIGNTEKIVKSDGSYEVKRSVGENSLWSHFFDASGAPYDPDGDGNSAEHVFKQHILRDALGSVRKVINSSTGVTDIYKFSSWGDRVDPSDGSAVLNGLLFRPVDAQPTTRGYTAHEMVDGLNVIHMGGRIYDPLLGRFLQSDPTVPDPTDTQSFNRYSYARNNPMNRVDPTGYGDCAINFEGCDTREYANNIGGYTGEHVLVTGVSQPPGGTGYGPAEFGNFFGVDNGSYFANYSNTANNLFSNAASMSGAISSGLIQGQKNTEAELNNKNKNLVARINSVYNSNGYTVAINSLMPKKSALNLVAEIVQKSSNGLQQGSLAHFNKNTFNFNNGTMTDAKGNVLDMNAANQSLASGELKGSYPIESLVGGWVAATRFTVGALLGGTVNTATYIYGSNGNITSDGLIYNASVGAFTGYGAGALSAASGGGFAGWAVWQPGKTAINWGLVESGGH